MDDDAPVLLTIAETATLMTSLGYPISIWTLREWRSNWIQGKKHGPAPLLLSTRHLRYEKENVVKVTRDLIERARQAAES